MSFYGDYVNLHQFMVSFIEPFWDKFKIYQPLIYPCGVEQDRDNNSLGGSGLGYVGLGVVWVGLGIKVECGGY